MRAQSLLLLGTCLWATGVAAQENEAQDTLFLGTLRIATPEVQSLLGNEEITQEDLEDRNPATMADIFAGESSVTASGGAAIAQKVFVNGIEESLLSVTIDGARQNKSAFHHTGNILLDPELLKSVEVSKGIAPADAGPNALAGGLAYTTKDARDLTFGEDGFGALASLRYGTGNQLRRALTAFGQHAGFEWLLSGTRHTSDDYKDGDGNTVVGTEADLSAYALKLAYTTDSGKRLSFAASKTEDTGARAAQRGPGGILFTRPDFFGTTTGASVLTDALSRRTSYTLSYVDEAPQGWFAPSAQISYNEQEIDASGVAGTNTSLSGFVKNTWQLSTGTVTAGVDFFKEEAKGEGRGPGPFASSGKEKLNSLGLFAQARQNLSDRLSVSYGGRVDRQSFEGADGRKFDDTGISANGSFDYMLSDSLSVTGGYASSWGGYELGEAALVNFGRPWSYDGFTSSRSKTGRIGLRFDNGTLSASAAVFKTEVSDLSAVLPLGGLRGATSDLVSQGYEATLGYQGEQGFARLSYTSADVELNEDTIGTTAYYFGRPVGQVIGLEAGYDLNDAWRFGGTAQVALENTDTPVELPSYQVVNVFANYTPELLQGMNIRLDVKNLFDETYVARSADGFGNPRVIPLNEPGRVISLTASMQF
jgi:hemoglobin/transferrin/lactoferrin receptor protein